MIKIKDVNVPTKGIGKYFFLYVTRMVLPGTSAKFYWEVNEEVVEPASESDEQTLKYPGNAILVGDFTITEQEYSQWGTDDNYIIDLALQKLGFERL